LSAYVARTRSMLRCITPSSRSGSGLRVACNIPQIFTRQHGYFTATWYCSARSRGARAPVCIEVISLAAAPRSWVRTGVAPGGGGARLPAPQVRAAVWCTATFVIPRMANLVAAQEMIPPVRQLFALARWCHSRPPLAACTVCAATTRGWRGCTGSTEAASSISGTSRPTAARAVSVSNPNPD